MEFAIAGLVLYIFFVIVTFLFYSVKNAITGQKIKRNLNKISFCITGVILLIIVVLTPFRSSSLKTKMSGASSLVVKDNVGRITNTKSFLYETNDRDEIDDFISHIKLIPSMIGSHCLCVGNVAFEFYDKDKLLCVFSLHHGDHIRTPKSLGDLYLSSSSTILIYNWLSEKGIHKFREELKEERDSNRKPVLPSSG